MEKFSNPLITANQKKRAHIGFQEFDTLWFNTGTQCNLQCKNCYIESSPKNDRLLYITKDDVQSYIEELSEMSVDQATKPIIGFTGGEPYMNPHFSEVLELSLSHGYECLVLTNAMHPMMRRRESILNLHNLYGDKLKFRISLDHHTEEIHNQERGPQAWKIAMKGIKWLDEQNISWSIAGRSLTKESDETMIDNYRKALRHEGIESEHSKEKFVIFAEMKPNADTPEITTECWGILNKKPQDIMCSSSRMVMKEKSTNKMSVAACTLLPYDEEFISRSNLKDSLKPISLNHRFCSQFCVLGGSSCS